MSKIFGHGQAGTAAAVPAPSDVSTQVPAAAAADTATDTDSGTTSEVTSAAPMSQVDVEAVLTELAAQYSHAVNWRYSIVDLMAILGIDNSLAQRKALAQELGYTGDMNDSATMNTWLHKEVMQRLEENGGIVPADMLQ